MLVPIWKELQGVHQILFFSIEMMWFLVFNYPSSTGNPVVMINIGLMSMQCLQQFIILWFADLCLRLSRSISVDMKRKVGIEVHRRAGGTGVGGGVGRLGRLLGIFYVKKKKKILMENGRRPGEDSLFTHDLCLSAEKRWIKSFPVLIHRVINKVIRSKPCW